MPRNPYNLLVQLGNQGRHWEVQLGVDGEVETRTVFGCREGFEPILRCLASAEAHISAVCAGSKTDPIGAPPSITVTMPSGRKLLFVFRNLQETIT
jgi:hypothetical protein